MFVLGVTVLLLGVVVMLVQRARRPGFFRGETLRRGVSDGAVDEAANLPD